MSNLPPFARIVGTCLAESAHDIIIMVNRVVQRTFLASSTLPQYIASATIMGTSLMRKSDPVVSTQTTFIHDYHCPPKPELFSSLRSREMGLS